MPTKDHGCTRVSMDSVLTGRASSDLQIISAIGFPRSTRDKDRSGLARALWDSTRSAAKLNIERDEGAVADAGRDFLRISTTNSG